MDLVGRDAELAAVERAVAAVRGGTSRVLAVVGEAGIGKSALMSVIAARADGLLVAWARAAEHERDLPFSLALEAFDRHLRALDPARLREVHDAYGVDLAPADCPAKAVNAAERFRYHRVHRAAVELLGPSVLLFDDVQWADDASLEVILHLLTRPPEIPHLLAFALRPSAAAARLLDAARRRPGIEQLSPGRLDDVAARALLGDIPDRERFVRDAAGNPLFLRELSRAAATSGAGAAPRGTAGLAAPARLPATLQAAVERELSALDAAARALVFGAAVAGDPFDPELAATAASDGSLCLTLSEPSLEPRFAAGALAALDALVAADLVRPSPEARGFGFRHPLVRRAVYDAAPPAWRLAAHERVATALEARGADAAKRAYHVARFARAGDTAAVEVLRLAAEAAVRTSPATAANWYAAALGLAPEADRAELLGPLALSLASAGRLEASLERLHEALELAPGDRELILTCARVESLRGDYAHARRRLEAAHAARPHPRLAFELAAAAMTATDTTALREWAATTERLATAAAGEPRRVAARIAPPGDTDPAAARRREAAAHVAPPRVAVTPAAPPGETDLAATGAARPARVAPPDAVLVPAARVLGALGTAWAGERVEADLLAPLQAFDDGALGAHPTLLLHVSRALLRLERTDDAAALIKRAVALGRRTSSGELLVWLLGVQAWALWLQLDLERALAAAEAAEETARMQAAPNPLLLALSVRAAIHHDRGEPAEAARAAADCAALISGLDPSDTTQMAAATLAGLHVQDDPERCLAELAPLALDPSWGARSALMRVRAALALGRFDDADGLARAAALRAAGVALPLVAIRAETGTAEVLLARGEPEAAAALAEAAALGAEGRAAPARVFNVHLAPAARQAAPRVEASSALDAAEARLLQGRALAAAGEPEAAKAVLQRLATDAARGQAGRLMAASARELRALGTRVSVDARRHERAELSEREREIAHLVADGNSNKQVAARLYLSEKTIENALTRVYAKVGVRSRAQLARAWAAS